MTKCLVTKYEGACLDDTLPKLGEFRMTVYSDISTDETFTKIKVSRDTLAEIVGNGYFTDSTQTENKGKTITLKASNVENIYIKCIEDCYFIIKDEMSLLQIQQLQKNIGFSLEDLAFTNVTDLYLMSNSKIEGNIKVLKNIPVASFWCNSKELTGDISVVKDTPNLNAISLSSPHITGDISTFKDRTLMVGIFLQSDGITGDVSVLSNLSALKELALSNTAVTGDINVLSNMPNLTYFAFNNTLITGDISVLKNLKNLTLSVINIHTPNQLYGNIGVIPDVVLAYITNIDNKEDYYTWENSTRKNILVGTFRTKSSSDSDAILNGMKDLTAKFAGSEVWYKNINIIGTHTSASDEAVATLQSKGYTVSITPA